MNLLRSAPFRFLREPATEPNATHPQRPGTGKLVLAIYQDRHPLGQSLARLKAALYCLEDVRSTCFLHWSRLRDQMSRRRGCPPRACRAETMIGVIADDLTGAAELGGVGLRHGLKVEVILQGECKSEADLICFDTDSRSCTAKEAALRAAAAAIKMRKAGARWIYKKVDSVLRGQVLAEIRAIQSALGLNSALLVPANPGLGRTIRNGRYYIKGKPIHQTDFARDPEYPRTSANVVELLGVSKGQQVIVSRPTERPIESGITLGEVSSSADLQKWARHPSANILLCGGAEFFSTLLDAAGLAAKGAGIRPDMRAESGRNASNHGRELFVCGSTSDFTWRFINESRMHGVKVFSLLELGKFPFGGASLKEITTNVIVAFRSHRRVVLAIGRPLLEKRSVSRGLAMSLTQIAVRVIETAKPEHVYAEGGATAAELVRQLGWKRLSVVKELAQGVTTLALTNRNSPSLTIKPGSYEGWPRLSSRGTSD